MNEASDGLRTRTLPLGGWKLPIWFPFRANFYKARCSNSYFIHNVIYFIDEKKLLQLDILPHPVWKSDHCSDLDNRCAWKLYEKEGCEQHEYSLWRHQFTVCSVEGQIQVNLSGLSQLARDEVLGGRILMAHMCDIKDNLIVKYVISGVRVKFKWVT